MGMLKGRVALVTGASRGIGAAIALALGREGAAVGVHYRRSKAQATLVVAAIRTAGSKALPLRADVTDGTSVRAMVAEMLSAFGQIDVLVNNAGILTEAPLHQMSDEKIG